jgi:phosphohistidine phosphatase
MDVYLARHGEARPESEDPARPLTGLGRQAVEGVARAAARGGIHVAVVQHSGKLRARETAEILASELHPRQGVRQMGGLSPNDDPAEAARALSELREPWLLVGHLPHLSRLVSLLLLGDQTRDIVAFPMGGLVGLSGSQEGWRLRLMLTPEMAFQR